MTPAWSDEDLRCLARDYRNHPDVYDLIEGVRRVLALCDDHDQHPGTCGVWKPYPTGRFAEACDCPLAAVLAALNDPNGA